MTGGKRYKNDTAISMEEWEMSKAMYEPIDLAEVFYPADGGDFAAFMEGITEEYGKLEEGGDDDD